MRFSPGACGFPIRGDSSFAASNNSFRRCSGTARAPRMPVLKCWNSGVASKQIAFINLPKLAWACRAPVPSSAPGTHLCSRLRFADEFIVGEPERSEVFNAGSVSVGTSRQHQHRSGATESQLTGTMSSSRLHFCRYSEIPILDLAYERLGAAEIGSWPGDPPRLTRDRPSDFWWHRRARPPTGVMLPDRAVIIVIT